MHEGKVFNTAQQEEQELITLSEADKKQITKITLGIENVPDDLKDIALSDLVSKLETSNHPLNKIYRNEKGDIAMYVVFDDEFEKGYIKYFGTDKNSSLSIFREIPALLEEARKKGYKQLSFHGWNKDLNRVLTRFGFTKAGTENWDGERVDYYKIDLKQKEKGEQKTPEFYQQKQLQKIISDANEFLEKHISVNRREEVKNKVQSTKSALLRRLSTETDIRLSDRQKAILELKLLRYFQNNESIDENVLFDAVQESPKRLNTTKDKSNIENIISAHRNRTQEQIKERKQLRAIKVKLYEALKDVANGTVIDYDEKKFASLTLVGRIHFLNDIINNKKISIEDKKATIAHFDDKFNLGIFSKKFNPMESVLQTNSGGYYLAKLLNAEHCEQEGEDMNHCIGDDAQPHKKRVEKGRIEAFSFRTSPKFNNKTQKMEGDIPLITIEYSPKTGRIEQIKKANDEYLSYDDEYYQDFVEALQKLKETEMDNGEKRKITSINTSELRDIPVKDDHVATGRGEIPNSDFADDDFVLKTGIFTEVTSDEKLTKIINKREGASYEVGQVARTVEEITEKTRYYVGDLKKGDEGVLNNRKNPLIIGGITDFENSTDLLQIPAGVSFGEWANFFGCTNLQSIAENVSFGGGADFRNCTSLQSIAENVSFGGYAIFSGCKNLQSIAENVSFAGNAIFSNCKNLQSIAENVSFGGNAYFSNCTSLQSIAENVSFGGDAYFSGCTSLSQESIQLLKEMKADGRIPGKLTLPNSEEIT